jgi:hypothetical protein
MRTIDILSPAALGPTDSHPLTPRLPSWQGRRLGIRIDHAWRSWWVAADELARLARTQRGVKAVTLFDPESRIGKPEEESQKVVQFAAGIDAAIVGLGT